MELSRYQSDWYGILSQEDIKDLSEFTQKCFSVHCCRAVEVSMRFDLGVWLFLF